jgi:hypothetical protein
MSQYEFQNTHKISRAFYNFNNNKKKQINKFERINIDAIVYTIHDCLCAYQKVRDMKKVKEHLLYIIKMFCLEEKDYVIFPGIY